MQDIRRISFSKKELFSAFKSYARKSPGFLPEGTLLSCTPQMTTEDGCSILVSLNTHTGKKELVYRDTAVLQPLILFCIENNVMLPRDGQKIFIVMDGQACLLIELNLNFDLSVEPMTSEDVSKLKKP